MLSTFFQRTDIHRNLPKEKRLSSYFSVGNLRPYFISMRINVRFIDISNHYQRSFVFEQLSGTNSIEVLRRTGCRKTCFQIWFDISMIVDGSQSKKVEYRNGVSLSLSLSASLSLFVSLCLSVSPSTFISLLKSQNRPKLAREDSSSLKCRFLYVLNSFELIWALQAKLLNQMSNSKNVKQ